MPDAPANRRSLSDSRRKGRKQLRHRWWFWAVIAVAAYILLSSVWIGVRGWQAKNALEAAQAQIGTLKQQAVSLDMDAARGTLTDISSHTANAESLTSDVVWRIAEIVPVLGPNLTAVRQIAQITNDTMTGVAAPLFEVAEVIDPASLAPKDGAVDLAPFTAAAGAVSTANDNMQAAVADADSIPTQWLLGPVDDARGKIVTMLGDLAPTLATLDVVVPLLPPVMGADGPRNYVMIFQNPAEPRALGGATLSLTLVRVDNGKVQLERTVAASTGAFSNYPESVIPIPDGADEVYPYGEFGTFIAEATARPSFTTAGQIVEEMWSRQFGEKVDGVISIDPVSLSYLLRATGPITLPTGDVLDEKSLVPMLLNGIYLRYANLEPMAANLAHDAFYGSAVQAMFQRLMSGSLDAKKLVGALVQGWDERRILFWSAHPDEEQVMAQVALNGELPVTDGETVRAGLYFQDSVGSKLSFYLRQSVQLSHATCEGTPTYRVQATLTNTIDGTAALTMPFHITGNWQLQNLYPGLNRLTMRMYAPPGSTITGASLDGQKIPLESLHDTDYPVAKMLVAVAPGATVTVNFDFSLPGDAGRAFDAQITPLVTPTAIENTPLDCATVAHD